MSHNVHTKFRENLSVGSHTNRQRGDNLSLLILLYKKGKKPET